MTAFEEVFEFGEFQNLVETAFDFFAAHAHEHTVQNGVLAPGEIIGEAELQ